MSEKPSANIHGRAAEPPQDPAEMIERLAATKEARKLAGAVVSEAVALLEKSAGRQGPVKRAAMKAAVRIVEKNLKKLASEDSIAAAAGISSVVSDPVFASELAKKAGKTSAGIAGMVSEIFAELEKLDTAQKKDILETLIENIDTEKSAQVLTSCLRMINEIHADEPEFLARVLAPGFEKWIASMDFGELKEAFDSGAQGVSALITMAANVIGEYPAKAVSMLTIAPTVVNIAADAIAQSLETAEKTIAPDMAADVVRSMLMEIDTGAVSRMINGLAEITRRLHVGSALIGEPGSPEFPKAFSDIARGIIEGIDHEILWKARTAIAETRGSLKSAITDAVAENPQMLAESIATRASVANAGISAARRRADAIEEQPPESIDDALARALSGLDVQEAAETINIYAALVNRLISSRPEVIAEKVDAFADALDTDEIAQLLEAFGRAAGESLLSMAQAAVPHIAKGFFKALAPAYGPSENAAKETKNLMKSLLNEREVDNE